MNYLFLLYIMQYLKFQLIKKQTPSALCQAVFYPPPAAVRRLQSQPRLHLFLSVTIQTLPYIYLCVYAFHFAKRMLDISVAAVWMRRGGFV